MKNNKTDIINFYELPEVQIFKKEYHNPNFKNHNINIPFRISIVGASGSGKSNITLNFIHQFSNTFNKIYIFTRADEQLYDYLKNKIQDNFYVNHGLDKLKEMDIDKDFKGQTLIIFDDLCLEKDQTIINEFFIRGRKIADGISLLYLSQMYTKIPLVIRSNNSYIILRKIGSNRDLGYILSENSLGLDKRLLKLLYEYCVDDSNAMNFLLIDIATNDKKKKFRKSFTEFIDITPFLE